MHLKKTVLAVAATLIAGIAQAGNDIVNGSFETSNVSPGGYLYAGAVAAPGWTFTGGTGIAAGSGGFNAPWGISAADGQNVAFIQNASSFSQTFADAASQYLISFSLAQRTNYGDVGSQSVSVTFDGQLLSGAALKPLAGALGAGWTPYSFTVTGSLSGTHTLSFAGMWQGWDSTVFVDGVSAAAIQSPVPEPGTYAMMMAGLGLIGFIGRRKLKRVA
ncbi:MAG: PEP-CTERM sorting domain-containing protein [Proteobacteria bacterium]|nr:PEP-CTERM sorting domain-containing protein [Pseudomonadota bacterium]